MSNSDDSLPPSGASLKTALRRLVETLDSRSIHYAIIGGIAAIQHARVRTTNDVDVLISLPQIAMPAFFEALQAAGFTIDSQANVLELRDDGMTTIRFADVLVDLMRPVLPLYAHVIDRAVLTDIFGQLVRISSPECLIVTKLIAFRPQDQTDIKDLISAYRSGLDVAYIKGEFTTIADLADSRWKAFESWLKELGTDEFKPSR